jgi:two-component system nitrate/nitrite response regulator NarL
MRQEQMQIKTLDYSVTTCAPWSPGQTVVTSLICSNGLLHMGLRHLLSDTCFEVSNTTFAAGTGLPDFPETGPSLFVLDASYGGGETTEVIRHVKAQCPGARLVVLADHFLGENVMEQRAAGADGFCLTTTTREVLIKSLELIMLGQPMLPPALVLTTLQDLSRRAEQPSSHIPAVHERHPSDPALRKLSAREAEILRCLTKGSPNKVIARDLDMAEATVKVHVKAILRKIGAGNRTQAALWASQRMGESGRPVANA